MHIPIENIYYLLCYAWDKLEEKDQVSVTVDDKTKLLDLLAKVLLNATKILLKRGIDRNYIDYTADIAGVKGKLAISETLKSNLLLKQRTICSFDEFSANILQNQLLFTTLYRLTRTAGVDKGLKNELKKVMWMFSGVELVEIRVSMFKQVKLHRNNRLYGFIMKVCQLVYENSMLAETAGAWEFSDFTRDERKMNQLFEAFIRNFYRIEQKVFKVRRENIDWQLTAVDVATTKYLPVMETDITLESKTHKIIIDAKYYRETMTVHYDREKIRSANLYQLFSYIMNQVDDTARSKSASGILLYPTIAQDYELDFKHGNHHISIKTVNLNTNWKNIEQRLKQIITA
jgi:5-methylcytosine-specific restriction enzyme subunit McrC